jgi:hypothetical protein
MRPVDRHARGEIAGWTWVAGRRGRSGVEGVAGGELASVMVS